MIPKPPPQPSMRPEPPPPPPMWYVHVELLFPNEPHTPSEEGDHGPFNSLDHKKWYTITPAPENEDLCPEHLLAGLQKLASSFGAKLEVLVLDAEEMTPEFSAAMASTDWANMRRVTQSKGENQ